MGLLISIITINYNNKSGLSRTIESVINQTYSNIQYIIIDGASTDGSKKIIKKYEHHISYWISEPDSGIYNAMNKGVDKAVGDYLLFLNSGDYLHGKHSKKCTFYTLRFGCSFAAVNTIKPQLL